MLFGTSIFPSLQVIYFFIYFFPLMLQADIEAGEAEQEAHLHHQALATVTVATPLVVAQFVVAPQLMHLGLEPLLVLIVGGLLLAAGAYQYHGHHWTPSLPNE